MATLAFDTHKFIKELSNAGMNVEQAEVLADHYTTLLTDRIATKEDISLLRKDMDRLSQVLEGKISGVEEHLEGKIGDVEERLERKMVSLEERLEGEMVSLEERLEGKMETMGKVLWIKMLISQLVIGALIVGALSYLG